MLSTSPFITSFGTFPFFKFLLCLSMIFLHRSLSTILLCCSTWSFHLLTASRALLFNEQFLIVCHEEGGKTAWSPLEASDLHDPKTPRYFLILFLSLKSIILLRISSRSYLSSSILSSISPNTSTSALNLTPMTSEQPVSAWFCRQQANLAFHYIC